jgi:phenylacetate-CoA ligase
MSISADPAVTRIQERFGHALADRLPDHVDRLGWDAHQLANYERQQLRALLSCALESSPFHARRLAGAAQPEVVSDRPSFGQ